jgi:hypothetical protein
LSNRTPRLAHEVRSPLAGVDADTSSTSSVKMLRRLAGSGDTSGATAKANPTADPGVGYGSWPTMSTRTSATGIDSERNTTSAEGRKSRPDDFSEFRKATTEASDVA